MVTESVESKCCNTDKKMCHSEISNQKIFLSRNLILRKNDENDELLINRLSSVAIKSSKSLLSFLSHFRERPIFLSSLLPQYSDTDLFDLVKKLLKLNFLIPYEVHEDLEWLKSKIDINSIKQFKTKHFLIFYSEKIDHFVRNFSDFIEDVYTFLLCKGFSTIDKHIIIYICKDWNEFQGFRGSGPSSLPAWPRMFVYSSNLLIIDQQKNMPINLRKESSFSGIAHELVHIHLGQMACQLSVWLEEGLCEYFSQPNYTKSFLSICKQKKIYSFKEIELFAKHSLLDLDDSCVEENICYRQSHSFVVYLISLKGEKYFMNCITSIGLDNTFKTLFQELYDQSVDDAEKAWGKNIRRFK